VRRVLLAAALALALVGCSQLGDRESGGGRQPDTLEDVTDVTVYRNIDHFPNVAFFCADGLAFWSTSSYDVAPSAGRLPERDGECAR
jgi:hypothetical protein